MEVSGQLHTSPLDGDEVLFRTSPFIPGGKPLVPIEYEAGSATEPVWILWSRNNLLHVLEIVPWPSNPQSAAVPTSAVLVI
jgi:hypothetical protein